MKRDRWTGLWVSLKVIVSLSSPLSQENPSAVNYHSQLSNMWWNHWQISDALVPFTPSLIHAGIIRFHKPAWKRSRESERQKTVGKTSENARAGSTSYFQQLLNMTALIIDSSASRVLLPEVFLEKNERCIISLNEVTGAGGIWTCSESRRPRHVGSRAALDKCLIKSIVIITGFLFQQVSVIPDKIAVVYLEKKMQMCFCQLRCIIWVSGGL